MKTLNNLAANARKNKAFWASLVSIFILYMITYPSVHHILGDEQLYLDLGQRVCKLDFSFYQERKAIPAPLYFLTICLTSPLHNYNLEAAELVTFMFTLVMIGGWHYSIPKHMDRKKFTVLMFANALVWTYSFRVLPDLPVAAMLSLGIFNMYLYLQNNSRKSFVISVVALSLSMLTKELSLLYFPIFFVYMIFFKKVKLTKVIVILLLPLIPYLLYSILIGNMSMMKYFTWAAGQAEGRSADYYSKNIVPYKNMPSLLFMAGTFGFGILSCAILWKDVVFDYAKRVLEYFGKLFGKNFAGTFRNKCFGVSDCKLCRTISKLGKDVEKLKKNQQLWDFLIFSLVLYVVWEAVFFMLPFKAPRYNIVLTPFFTLMISESSKKSKRLKYLYYLTLLYTLLAGFAINYYFHISEGTIWEEDLATLIKKISGR